MPARSLRIIFSTTSGCSCAFMALKPASDSPPALARSLWHPAQYVVTSSDCAAGLIACDAAGAGALARRTGAEAGAGAAGCGRAGLFGAAVCPPPSAAAPLPRVSATAAAARAVVAFRRIRFAPVVRRGAARSAAPGSSPDPAARDPDS